MKIIDVNLLNRSYSIQVEDGLLASISGLLKQSNIGQKWIIISQHRLMELFGFDLMDQLNQQGYYIDYITVPTGETAKSMIEFNRIISQMIELKCDRSTTILALGGGVVGDVAGFVASSFMRGIDYYQIPTTLLAMVDSSIGGKTGINISEGKNLVGAIYQPKGVFIDPRILDSLPREEVVSGLGEILKYGAIKDESFFSATSQHLENLDTFPFENAIARSCEIKAKIVSQDECEGGLRRLLNFGHTIGHALEAHFGYGQLRHGDAVSYGMISAGWISKELGLLKRNEYKTFKQSILRLPLPSLNKFDPVSLLPFIKNDKKTVSGILHFVTLTNIGSASTNDNVTDNLLISAMKEIQ
ncbi:MAG: 3-dehydroquinate synthase [Candidatus Marinimicrobia bacterium]|jgi:3-dehydroquinate synthase|nr:3-dehydroquinate synthase [Candidatus Neomarinimicrobiota bacterium]MBT3936804.1 3-dehydroquinate synthase [Candidatus Neomarinimicrobiota bacterium]MBT3962001.1 3-dehydroquinate synthase [Candidatus Neomarinimicrobiota bacterium]MBT4383691.1 3-dehydroquinate synthase [Candidatus Neomarinimicrobiota bacterium]MBT4637166.1 3-dehydroquinate synthase [Candidatus Neomarinimicrobiota bacterium]